MAANGAIEKSQRLKSLEVDQIALLVENAIMQATWKEGRSFKPKMRNSRKKLKDYTGANSGRNSKWKETDKEEPSPRTAVSGLVSHVPLELSQNSKVISLWNQPQCRSTVSSQEWRVNSPEKRGNSASSNGSILENNYL
ncbi:hypothetical protein A6R68_09601 [Neotoma lepida]|uniref:Uncharacterized protein n=1 Tax=Neotoma lepida TaxID=56216 RepID=A0A1A6G0E0_NEOLE|nr:hypothetical protein A6R68_09601 [Neotoma lepida]